jgi:hypothetical protein
MSRRSSPTRDERRSLCVRVDARLPSRDPRRRVASDLVSVGGASSPSPCSGSSGGPSQSGSACPSSCGSRGHSGAPKILPLSPSASLTEKGSRGVLGADHPGTARARWRSREEFRRRHQRWFASARAQSESRLPRETCSLADVGPVCCARQSFHRGAHPLGNEKGTCPSWTRPLL